MIEGLQLSIPHRMSLLRNTLVLALMVSFSLSFKLWIGVEKMPTASLLTLSFNPSILNYVLVILLFFLWLGSMFLYKQRLLLFFAFLICVSLCLMDVNRLQPWFYIYNMMLFVFLFYNGRVDDSSKYTSFFILLQIIVASVYFFSGWNQLNDNFIDTDFRDTISPLKSLFSDRQFEFLKKMGVLVPFLLMFVGIGLLITSIRYLAISLALVFHLLLLIFLVPNSVNLNYSLWISNLVFIPLVLLLFSGKTKQRYFSPLFLLQKPLFYLVMVLFVLLPFFNNANYWPDFLSSNFRSGNNRTAMISLSNKTVESLPFELRQYCEPHYGFRVFNYDKWYLEEKHVNVFPSSMVFTSIYDYLKESCDGDVKEIELQTIRKQKLLLKP